MTHAELILVVAACISLGFILGYVFRIIMALARKNSVELEIKRLSVQAEEKGKQILLKAEQKASETLESARNEVKKKEEDTRIELIRVKQKEEILEKRNVEINREIEHIKKKVEEIQKIRTESEEKQKHIVDELQKVAFLTKDQAREQILKRIEDDEAEILSARMHKLEVSAEEQLEDRAREILTTIIQRLASAVNQDHFVSTVAIKDEETKGKVIGKEGRNIKAFERESGTEILVDEASNSISISSFDPIRRYVAKLALENLIKDGRIQPAKIEKTIADTRNEVNKIMKDQGERAIFEAGIPNMDARLISILGRLHFRTSYGQNVLQHSIECAHIAGMLAEELKANVRVAKTGALLHDIGKALDHEVSGTHVEIGRQLLQKFGMEESVIKAMQAHHEEYPYETLESRIVQTADAISGGRPGARNNSVEFYIKRLGDLEQIALRQKGVEKAFALQAGREIRIFVNADHVSDFEAKNIAKNVARDIEKDLRYPGEIKVTVIRETRVIETAR